MKGLRIAGLLAVGLFLAALALIALPTTAARSETLDVAGAEPRPVSGPTVRAMPPVMYQQPQPGPTGSTGPTHSTFVIHYQGQDASPELMLALANLETGGQISALDAASATGRVFVLGEPKAMLTLGEFPGVTSITEAGLQPGDESLSNEPELPAALFANPAPPGATGIQAPTGVATTGSISGTVTAEGSGAPLGHVDVNVHKANGDYLGDYETDAAGVYRFDDLAVGDYKLRFGEPIEAHVLEWYDDKPSESSADRITVVAGETTVINAQLAKSGVVKGVVTGQSDGAPLTNVRVKIYGVRGWGYNNPTSYYVYTDDLGAYRMYKGLASGNYKLSFDDYGRVYAPEFYDNQPNLDSADLIPITAGMTTTIDVQLARGGVLMGKVTAEDSGKPLFDVGIAIHYPGASGTVVWGSTDGNGTYRISGLASCDCKVEFYNRTWADDRYLSEYYDDKPDWDSADIVAITVGMTTTIDAQLALPEGGISGVVTAEGSGAPLGDVWVTAYYRARASTFARSDTTDAAGVYRISHLKDDDYKLLFRDSTGVHLAEYYDNKSSEASADPVFVIDGGTTTVNAQLTPGSEIMGTVTAEGGSAPVDSITVNVRYADTNNIAGSDTTDAAGTYHIRSLASGDYTVSFSDTHDIYLAEYYDDKPDWNSADIVTITAATTTILDAQLTGSSVVKGVVTDEGSGAPLEGVQLTLYEANTGDYARLATTDASGAYYINGLRANLYKMFCEDSSGQYMLEWHQDKLDEVTATPITVSARVTTTVNVALARGARITGRVTDADSGAGIKNVTVLARRLDTATLDRWGSTDANGYYAVTALYTGVHQVQFDAPLPYYDQYYAGFNWGDGFDPITVTAPLTTTGINATLHKGNVISGVVSAGSTPLSGVQVQVYRSDSTSYSASNSTDSQGIYRLGPLAPNQYRVYFKPSSLYASEWYSDSASYAGSTAINLSGDLGNVNADLVTGGSITGRVTGPGGAPLADLWIKVYPAGHSTSVASAKTNDDGYYATTATLSTGQYQLDFDAPFGYTREWYDDKSLQSSATAVSVVAGQTTGNVNAQLATYAHGTLAGTVKAADTGLPLNTWVHAYSDSGRGTWSNYAVGGSFVLQGLPPDAYRVLIGSPSRSYVSRYYHDKADSDSADLVMVTAGMTTSLAVQTLPVSGAISGTVSGPGGGILGVHVYAQRAVGGHLNESTYTGVDGGYHLPGLDAGEYQVQFIPPSPFIRQWYNDAPDADAASYVTVTLGATTPNVDVTLTAGGVITGLVTAADTGAPLPGAYVYAAVPNATAVLVQDWTVVRADGQYQTPGLPAGNYQVYFDVGPWNRYIAEWYDDARPSSLHMTVTVPVSGVTPNINAALDQGGSISGWTYNALKGLPMTGVDANVYDAASGSYIHYDSSNGGGLYQVNGLPSGQYEIYFSKSGFKTQRYSQTLGLDWAGTATVNAPDDIPNINVYLEYIYGVYLPLLLRQAP